MISCLRAVVAMAGLVVSVAAIAQERVNVGLVGNIRVAQQRVLAGADHCELDPRVDFSTRLTVSDK
ncbi:MAG: hypothetical protein JWL62_3244 [Hyphomicrobiales bacterium]|nr:hypothetical protein [Hyphomicrobiales bacterium]